MFRGHPLDHCCNYLFYTRNFDKDSASVYGHVLWGQCIWSTSTCIHVNDNLQKVKGKCGLCTLTCHQWFILGHTPSPKLTVLNEDAHKKLKHVHQWECASHGTGLINLALGSIVLTEASSLSLSNQIQNETLLLCIFYFKSVQLQKQIAAHSGNWNDTARFACNIPKPPNKPQCYTCSTINYLISG